MALSLQSNCTPNTIITSKDFSNFSVIDNFPSECNSSHKAYVKKENLGPFYYVFVIFVKAFFK